MKLAESGEKPQFAALSRWFPIANKMPALPAASLEVMACMRQNTLSLLSRTITMQVLLYNELNPQSISGFSKWRKLIEADDFKSADVKKVADNLYRARLNRNDRLLFSLYQHQGQAYALVLEYIKNHDYSRSRFLNRSVVIDEDKLPVIASAPEEQPPLAYINTAHERFNVLDKIISFDEAQQDIFALNPPMIIIGSAGSGKTALTLEKMKQTIGDVLYVTLSPYLVKNSRDLYFAHQYENEDQQVDFFSFEEYLESIQVPQGKPVDFHRFEAWFARQRSAKIKDAHKLFEEFKGVLTGPSVEHAWLDRKAYLALGVKQSIFMENERDAVYDLFERYLAFMQENALYDSNILSHQYLHKVEPRYDFVVVDEVQDLTNIQLFLILKSLMQPGNFILCGDSNQIVHPNFFSWSKVKSLFYQQDELLQQANLIRILQTNYRNSPDVTEIANRVLLLKNARFGSIDKESNYLVKSNGHVSGNVIYLQDNDAIRRELDNNTRSSTRFAVIVMHPGQKQQARQHFNTPLVFSIQEAKGLEYENIILYNFVSAEVKRFRDISAGITPDDLQGELNYARAKDKTDKSLEVYKFYINALYVALTRAVKNLYWIEADTRQHLLELLGLGEALAQLDMENQNSSLEEWQHEAHKLELQGKQEQAERIRSEILKQQTPDWKVYQGEALQQLYDQAIEQQNKKAKLMLFEYALVYEDNKMLTALTQSGFNPAKNPENGLKMLKQKHFMPYQTKNPAAVLNRVKKFGVDFRNPFNQTPFMVAAWLGNADLIETLAAYEPDTELVDNNQHNALQIALAQASREEKYAHVNLSAMYRALEPDSLSIQVDGRLVKLGNHLMEFVLLNLLIAVFYRVMPDKLLSNGGFESADIVEAVQHFSEDVLPQRRKKKSYISSILSKNEVERDDRYNRKLFKRIKRGHYVFNPALALKLEGEWVNIYNICQLDKLHYHPAREMESWWWKDENYERYELWLHQFREDLKARLGLETHDAANES